MTKTCKDCGETKVLSLFSVRKNPNNTTTVYHCPYCKVCMMERTYKWQYENFDLFRSKQKQYREKVKERKDGTEPGS